MQNPLVQLFSIFAGFILIWLILFQIKIANFFKRVSLLLLGFTIFTLVLYWNISNNLDNKGIIIFSALAVLLVFNVLADTWFCETCGKNYYLNWATKNEKICSVCRADLRNCFWRFRRK